MKLLLASAVAASLAGAPIGSTAGFYDGNELKKLSDSQNLVDIGQFRGYVAAIVDYDDFTQFCVADHVRLSQLAAIVQKYLNDNPKVWHLPAAIIVINALKTDFPCKSKK